MNNEKLENWIIVHLGVGTFLFVFVIVLHLNPSFYGWGAFSFWELWFTWNKWHEPDLRKLKEQRDWESGLKQKVNDWIGFSDPKSLGVNGTTGIVIGKENKDGS